MVDVIVIPLVEINVIARQESDMGLRFRKSLKILPSVKLNITNQGISSVSLGGKGLRTNIGKKGVRTTTSIKGTELSYSQYTPYQATQPHKAQHVKTSTFKCSLPHR